MNLGHAHPIGLSLRKPPAIRVGIADPRHEVEISGPELEKALVDGYRFAGVFGMKVRERTKERSGAAVEIVVGRIGRGQHIGCTCALLKVRLPQTRFHPKSLGRGIARNQSAPVGLVDLGGLLPQGFDLGVETAGAAEQFEELIAQRGRLGPVLPQKLLELRILSRFWTKRKSCGKRWCA